MYTQNSFFQNIDKISNLGFEAIQELLHLSYVRADFRLLPDYPCP
jgi:hypothetical protein